MNQKKVLIKFFKSTGNFITVLDGDVEMFFIADNLSMYPIFTNGVEINLFKGAELVHEETFYKSDLFKHSDIPEFKESAKKIILDIFENVCPETFI